VLVVLAAFVLSRLLLPCVVVVVMGPSRLPPLLPYSHLGDLVMSTCHSLLPSGLDGIATPSASPSASPPPGLPLTGKAAAAPPSGSNTVHRGLGSGLGMPAPVATYGAAFAAGSPSASPSASPPPTLSATATAFQPTSSVGALSHAFSNSTPTLASGASGPSLVRPVSDGSLTSTGTTVCHLALMCDTPVQDCLLKPHIIVRDPLTNSRRVISEDDDSAVKCRWLRGQRRVCAALGCSAAAKLQCVPCAQQQHHLAHPPLVSDPRAAAQSAEIADMSFFCSNDCLAKAWPQHRQLHARYQSMKKTTVQSSWTADDCDDDSLEGQTDNVPSTSSSGTPSAPSAGTTSSSSPAASTASSSSSSSTSSSSQLFCKFPSFLPNRWNELTTDRQYTPVVDDVGRALRFEVLPIIGGSAGSPGASGTEPLLGPRQFIDTQPTMPAPAPPLPRHVCPLTSPEERLHLAQSPFKVVCYNVLADIYANRQIYPYCPTWALAWNYRRNNILRELLSYNSDLLCLQEVQGDHFENFFQPQLAKHGYEGVFKSKTRDALGDNPNAIDGCAIFFRRERFALMEQYSIEFNEAARQFMDRNHGHVSDKKAGLRRLLKGNVALVVVLEEIESSPAVAKRPGMSAAQAQAQAAAAAAGRRRKRRLCVANTHIYWDPEFEDVKLWQTWVLCQELEKLVSDRNLPMLLCGDFNSMPESAVYDLLCADRRVKQDHDVFSMDLLGLLPKASAITHRLPFASAYASRSGEEPPYTNFTVRISHPSFTVMLP
jgi:CCR4-NOT transcription complex subunit 6